MKRFVLIFCIMTILFCSFSFNSFAITDHPSQTVNAKSAILMEATTGEILYKQNEQEALPPASVTKIMTLLLVMEAIADGRIQLSDTVCISKNAASMGGSQVFLEEGESFSVEELLKCCVIASANDAAVALAEHTYGTEEFFVARMNARAQELGLQSTKFENTTGLDDTVTAHLTSAKDIAIMSKELIQYPKILEYSCLWQDTIRDGAFTLTNTNRLVRFFKGCTGLKTGSTDKAGYCVSVTAQRGDLSLICVVMGAPDRDERNKIATGLLEYGFSQFSLYTQTEKKLEQVPVLGGTVSHVYVEMKAFSSVISKGEGKVNCVYDIPQCLNAPIKKGDKIGTVYYEIGSERIGESDIVAMDDVNRITFMQIFFRFVMNFIMGIK